MYIQWRIQFRIPPPAPFQKDPIFSFSHTFLPKSTRVGSRFPPTGRRPPAVGNPESAANIHEKMHFLAQSSLNWKIRSFFHKIVHII